MSSGIIIENTENVEDKPTNLSEPNFHIQNKMSNSEQCDSNSINLEDRTSVPRIGDFQDKKKSVTIEDKTEETIIEEVIELNLNPKENHASENETAVSNNESLSYLQGYNSENDETGSEDVTGSDDTDSDDNIPMQGLKFRDIEDESEDSEADSVADDYDIMDEDGAGPSDPLKPEDLKADQKNDASWISELGLSSDLQIPDISTLKLDDKEEFQHIGNIQRIMKKKIITIEALPAMPAYDLDTLFFVEGGQEVLGYVCDVMGPVTSPIYVVNLDLVEKVDSLQLKEGSKIYCAPKSKYTKYVFLQELMKIRGSDASWVGDTEVPQEFVEFSDDEEERQNKSQNKKAAKRKHSSLERHQQFETNMNKMNQLNSRLHNAVGTRNPPGPKINQTSPRTGHSKNSNSQWVDQPHFSRQNNLQTSLDRSQSLETYLQNCTSQFMQQWRPQQMNPPGPPQQFSPGLPQQFSPAPPHQFSPAPPHQFSPAPPRQFPPGPTHQFPPGATHQFPPGATHQFPPGATHQFPPGPLQQFPPGPPQKFYSPEHFLTPPGVPCSGPVSNNFVPQFDPCTPPPNYGGPTRGYHPSFPSESCIPVGRLSREPYMDFTSGPEHPAAVHRRKSGHDFRYNRPGPSNGN